MIPEPKMVRCYRCKGRGTRWFGLVNCWRCEGTGEVTIDQVKQEINELLNAYRASILRDIEGRGGKCCGGKCRTNQDSTFDAPACKECGTITVRSGPVYRCLNCGTESPAGGPPLDVKG